MKHLFLIYLILLGFSCTTTQAPVQASSYESNILNIQPLTEHTYIHISYLQTQDFGKVACNGLIYVNGKEAIVFDTPVTNAGSQELIDWVQDSLGYNIKAVVPGHFHDDCLGGLQAFHDAGIASYAHTLTLNLAAKDSATIPMHGFDKKNLFQIGREEVVSEFLGEGHTRDNVVSYIPSEKVLFGGCLVKSLGAGEGFTGDGNVNEWSRTVRKVKDEFSEVEYVVPGHGEAGNIELLDYTIKMFQKE